jgi:hypothetical protein
VVTALPVRLYTNAKFYARTNLRIDFIPNRAGVPDAVNALKQILDRCKPTIGYYKVRPHNPSIPECADWLAAFAGRL